MLTLLIPLVSAHTITVPTNAYFGFGTEVYINFDTQQTFDTIKRESNYWYFGDYGLQIQNANATVTTFFSGNKLVYSVTVASGQTGQMQIYCGDYGRPLSVSGATNWVYSSATNIVTLTHTNSTTTTVDWVAPSSILALFRTNYYIVLAFLSLIPLAVCAFMVILVLRGKQTPKPKDIIGLVSMTMMVIVIFIIVHAVLNAIIGG